MKKIIFRNSLGWKRVFAELCANQKSDKTELFDIDSDGNFKVGFDSSIYESVCFSSELSEKTVSLYPGESSFGVEYKANSTLGRNASYLYLEDCKSTGRVDNFTLTDEKNLLHRPDKSKKISVFVPHHYDGSEPYDLLYFFDAQNLFGGAGEYTQNGDPYGSWQLDLVLEEIYGRLGKKIIVIGIDNADEFRNYELFMDHRKFGKLAPLATAIPEDDFSKGYLDEISDFMTDTLHSFIKTRYSVKEDNIGIGGSSMGGIASFYCALREGDFYSYALSYSPAFGLYEMSAFEDYFAKSNFALRDKSLPKIHIYCGGGDMLEKMLLPSAKEMKRTLVKYGYPEDKVFETYDAEKPHNEESWRMVLPLSFGLLLD